MKINKGIVQNEASSTKNWNFMIKIYMVREKNRGHVHQIAVISCNVQQQNRSIIMAAIFLAKKSNIYKRGNKLRVSYLFRSFVERVYKIASSSLRFYVCIED